MLIFHIVIFIALYYFQFFSHTYSLFINDISWLVGKWACVCVCVCKWEMSFFTGTNTKLM